MRKVHKLVKWARTQGKPTAGKVVSLLAGAGLVYHAVGVRYPKYEGRGDVRPSLAAPVKELQEYARSFDSRKEGSFVAVLGPQASGKTSAIELAFGGWHGVHYHSVDLITEEIVEVNLKKTLAGHLGFLTVFGIDAWATRLWMVDLLSRTFLGRHYVVVLNLKSKDQHLTQDQLHNVAAKAAAVGRSLCYDKQERICALVLETSVPQLGDAIAGVQLGSICAPIHIMPVGLGEFKLVAAEYVMNEWNSKQLLSKLGIKPKEPAPRPGWFEKDEDARKKYTVWLKKNILTKDFEQVIEDYFCKVGPNVRRLSRLIAATEDGETFAKKIQSAHDKLMERLVLSDKERELAVEMIQAGPHGLLIEGKERTSLETSIIERPTTDTIARRVKDRVTMHYVGHVYAVLMQAHGDDAKVRALMKEYGWIDMCKPAKVVSA
eukprot:Rhum_TRINITY_DN9648_c1_g1::Rhum_TRINITY_DN9648_c1_g1_i1::g.34237::m.34237